MKNRLAFNPWFLWPVLAFLAAGVSLLFFLPYGEEILFLNDYRTEPLNTIFRSITKLGEAPVFVVLGLAALFWRFRLSLLIALAGLVISPTSYIAKDKIGVDRPVTYFEKSGRREAVVLVPGEHPNGGQTSFPSGHTMAAFGLYGLLALLLSDRRPWIGLLCAVLAISVAISRVFLVQHFLADILGGSIMGLAVASLVWWLDVRYFQRFGALDRGFLSLNKGGQDLS